MEAAAEAKAAEGGVVLGQGAIAAMEKALRTIGAICCECERPTYFPTLRGPSVTQEFMLATAKIEEGKPKVVVQRAYACVRRDCEGAKKLIDHPDVIAVRSIPSWEILAGQPPDDLEEER